MKKTKTFLILAVSIILLSAQLLAGNNILNTRADTTIPGDSNCDENVDLLDIISIANYIMGFNPQPFCFDNADVNNDGIINISDMIGTINIILGGGFVCGNSAIADIDGNVYNTVLIGGQCWMKENLKTTTYRNNNSIEYPGSNNAAWQSNTTGAYAWYNNDISWKDSFGALYNWYATNNTNGLCPTGWHVPSDTEWTQLVDYVVAQGYPNSSVTNGAGNALKSCRQVNSPLGGDCNTTAHPRWNEHSTHHGFDAFGFSGLPGGDRFFNGLFFNIGTHGVWYTATENGTDYVWFRSLGYLNGIVSRVSDFKNIGRSVRCLRD